jgi:hypothetical protein
MRSLSNAVAQLPDERLFHMKSRPLASNSEKELADLLRVARNSRLFLIGPFRRRSRGFVFGFTDAVITETELKELQMTGSYAWQVLRS